MEEFASDPDYQAFLADVAKHCRCSRDRPCDGVLAGGFCDNIQDDENEDWDYDDPEECGPDCEVRPNPLGEYMCAEYDTDEHASARRWLESEYGVEDGFALRRKPKSIIPEGKAL